MKILISNDDGVRDPGLWAIAEEMAKFAEVTIVAPDSQRSAVSHAITLHKPLRIARHEALEKDGIRVFSTNGTPSDSVMLGVLEIAPDSDLLISGINAGPNMGEDVLYSGTVAAAMEGALLDVPSLSISLSDYESVEYELAARFAAGLAPQVLKLGLPKRTVLNINVPSVKLDAYKGFKVTRLGTRKYTDILQKRIDPRGRPYYWITGRLIRDDTDNGSDNSATAAGFISITPIVLDFTDAAMIERLKFTDPLEK